MLTDRKKDPMGQAIYDRFHNIKPGKLKVMSSMFDDDFIPIETLFRTYEEMPELEKTALQMAQGRILDLGAASGCHSLVLQEMGRDVTAADISQLSCEVMRERGVRNVLEADFYDESFVGEYDTILMLMNGSGIIGTVENMANFFFRAKHLLSKNGCILMDSSDLSYLYEEEDGSIAIDLAGAYYGEVDYTIKYKNVKGETFDWLYVDFDTLAYHAEANGFKAELVQRGPHYDYLARLSL